MLHLLNNADLSQSCVLLLHRECYHFHSGQNPCRIQLDLFGHILQYNLNTGHPADWLLRYWLNRVCTVAWHLPGSGVKWTLLHTTVALLLSSAELRPDWQQASWGGTLSAYLQHVKLAAHTSMQIAGIGLVSNHVYHL